MHISHGTRAPDAASHLCTYAAGLSRNIMLVYDGHMPAARPAGQVSVLVSLQAGEQPMSLSLCLLGRSETRQD